MQTPPDLDAIEAVTDLDERATLIKEAREITNAYIHRIRQLRDDTYVEMRRAQMPVRRSARLLGISTSTGEAAWQRAMDEETGNG